jgi:RNA polymerase sigma-70 factor (ECF subfamily)
MSGISQQIALTEPGLASNEETSAAEEQFTALVRRQSSFVFRVAHCVLRNTYDAEDVVQDVFLKLYRTQAWKKINDERAFLARTAWRLAVERLPKKVSKSEPAEQRSKQQTPEEEVIRADRNALLQRLVDALPPELRLPLALSAVEGLPSHQIATVMGIPDGTVRTRIARARKILKGRLAALMEFDDE